MALNNSDLCGASVAQRAAIPPGHGGKLDAPPASDEYRGLDISRRTWRQRMLDGIRPELRALPFRLIDQEAVRNLRDELLPK